MKIRNGFVSNSSSTSFTFVIKGEYIEDLFFMLDKYGEYFNLYGNWGAEKEDDIQNCNVYTVMERICKIKDKRIIPIDTAISDVEEKIKHIAATYASSKGEHNAWLLENSFKYVYEKADLEKLKKSGFTTVVEIDFGDNHGDVCGGVVGYLMDYEGRNIYINKPDFVVWTEQNR